MKGVHAVVTAADVPLQRLRPPLGARHPRRRAAARRRTRCATSASRSRSSPPRTRRSRRPPSTRSRSTTTCASRCSTSARRSTRTRRRSTQWGNWYPHFEGEHGPPPDPQGRHRRRLRAGRPDRPGRLPAGRDRAAADRDPGLPGRARGERPADDLLLHAGALLLDGRRRRPPAAAAEQAQVRRRHRRRRLRRQGRHGDRDALLRCSRSSRAGR